MGLFARVVAVVTSKTALGLTLGVLAVGAAGAVGAAASTTNPNPALWGAQVVQQVQNCKAALASGEHGIGTCVASFARTHGSLVSSEHRASGARTNSSDHRQGPPAGVHTGPPSWVQTGPHSGPPTNHGKP
jgi:hypothetical protein